MKVFVVGGGGREHAILWKLKQNPRITELFCAPGNAGIAALATCVPIGTKEIDALVAFSLEEQFDLVFVAPDDPLALGLVDRLTEKGIRAFGPTAAAARIEASKSYAKDLMQRYKIPTADYGTFEKLDEALAYLSGCSFPLVIKADGLALGKGVVIAANQREAEAAIRSMMETKVFGAAGSKIVVEEFLEGPELTILAFCDGKTIRPLLSSRDHKRALDRDQGLNTGGMGAIAPGAALTEAENGQIYREILLPTVKALAQEGNPFCGVLYFGLMLTADGPKVIEYNARLGDPEAQVLLPRLENDLLDVIEACLEQRLDGIDLTFTPGASCVVVMASGGYPEGYETGFPIYGIPAAEALGTLVFQSGTKVEGGKILTAGGRVLGVYAEAEEMDDAIEKAYRGVAAIHFKNMHFRTDIGRS